MSLLEARLHSDFKYFCKWSWPDIRTNNDIIITPQHLELVKLLMHSRKALVVAYRWFGKSTIATFKYPLWRATQHGKSVVILSYSEDLAIDKLSDIKLALETIPNLQRYCGKWYATWTDRKLTIIDREKWIKWPDWKMVYPIISVIQALWFNSAVRWVHADIIIADDVVIEENTLQWDKLTPDPTKISATKALFKWKVVPIKNPWWSVVLVWTPIYWDENDVKGSDLLYEWYKNKKTNKFFLPAVDEFWEPNCPWLHDKEFLEEQKDMLDETTWQREYMLQPKIKSARFLSDEDINRARDYSRTYIDIYTKHPDEVVFIWTDYAVIDNKAEAEKKNSAYFALIAVAYNRKTQIRKVLNIHYERWVKFSQQLELTKIWAYNFQADAVCMESHWWMRYFMSEIKKLLHPSCKVIDATNKWSKLDTFTWLPSLTYLFEKDLINLACGDRESKDKTDWLRYEILFMRTSSHLDVVDALLRVDIAIRQSYRHATFKELNYDKIMHDKKQDDDFDNAFKKSWLEVDKSDYNNSVENKLKTWPVLVEFINRNM